MKAHLLFLTAAAVGPLWALDNDNDGMDDLWQQRYGIAPFTGSANPDGDARINLVESRNFSDPHAPNQGLGLVFIKDVNPEDGLPDDWQQQFQLTPADNMADPDQDGRTNYEEALLMSHPFVTDFPFSMVAANAPALERPGPDQFLAKMPVSAQGRRYLLETSETLAEQSWTAAQMVSGSPYVWGTGGEISGLALTGGVTKMFFRWRIDDPDSDGDFIRDWDEMQLGTNVNQADSDGDGVPDGNEMAQGEDPLQAIPVVPKEQGDEQTGPMPILDFVHHQKSVLNTWWRDVLPDQSIEAGSMLSWLVSPGGDTGFQNIENNTPLWQAKLNSLTYPLPTTQWYDWNWTGGGVLSHTYWGDQSSGSPDHELMLVIAQHHKAIARSVSPLMPAPWNMVARGYRWKVTSGLTTPGGEQTQHSYSPITKELFSIAKDHLFSSKTVLLEPNVEANKEVYEELATVKFYVTTNPRSLDLVSNNGLSAAPEPTPWLMLPKNEARDLEVFMNDVNEPDIVFQVSGAGFDINVPPPSFVETVTLQSGTEGVAKLKVGLSPGGDPTNGAVYTPDDVLSIQVCGRKELYLEIRPIGYQAAPGGSTLSTQHLPSEQVIQDFFDYVFLEQTNIKVKVKVLPEIGVAWDLGIGPVAIGSGIQGVGDKCLQILDQNSDQPIVLLPTNSTLEDAAIMTAAPPNPNQNTITMYYVMIPTVDGKQKSMFSVNWKDGVDETNREASRLIYNNILGVASRRKRANGFVCWVKDRDTVGYGSHSCIRTMAHEIGHMLGLWHPFDGGVTFSQGENEDRLMSARWGKKKVAGLWRFVHQEWVIMRSSGILYDPPL